MSDTIEDRLKETSAICLETYVAWSKDKKDTSAYQSLHSAVHELRKVASRLEIELASSERDSAPRKNIKPPQHKTTKAPVSNDADDGAQESSNDRPRQRRTRKPKAASGGAE